MPSFDSASLVGDILERQTDEGNRADTKAGWRTWVGTGAGIIHEGAVVVKDSGQVVEKTDRERATAG